MVTAKLYFPAGAGVKNLPANHGFHPWSGKIPRAAKQLNLCAATKPVCRNYWARALEFVLHKERSPCNEKPMHLNQKVLPTPVSAAKEKPMQQWRLSTAKK